MKKKFVFIGSLIVLSLLCYPHNVKDNEVKENVMVADITPKIEVEEVKYEESKAFSYNYKDEIPLTYIEQEYLFRACDEFNIDYSLALGMIDVETKFQNIKGDKGRSLGYMQIQPRWHKKRMEEIGAKDLMIPYDNFRTGLHFMNELLSKHNLVSSLTYYNQGRYGTSKYATKVIERMNYWKGVLNS